MASPRSLGSPQVPTGDPHGAEPEPIDGSEVGDIDSPTMFCKAHNLANRALGRTIHTGRAMRTSSGDVPGDNRPRLGIKIVTGGQQPRQHSRSFIKALNTCHRHIVAGPMHDLDRVSGADLPG